MADNTAQDTPRPAAPARAERPPGEIRHPFNEAGLLKWMQDNVPGFEGPISVKQFGFGQSCPTYELTTPNKKYVMRRKPPGKLLPSAHAVDREFKVISGLYPTGFPVAQPYGLCTDDSVVGTMFYVMGFADGRVLLDQTLPNFKPEERRAIHMSVVETMARLHNTDYKKIGLEDYGKPGNYMMRQIDRWTKQYRASETEDIPEMNKLMEWLPKSCPPDDETSIVHGDYRLDNVSIHKTGTNVIAVLDWELGTLGNPMADFSNLLMQWYNGSLGQASKDPAYGIPTADEAIHRYCELRGRKDGVDQIDWYISYNIFRLAAIIQGIVGRVRDGTASSATAAQNSGRVGILGKSAWRFAQKAGAV